jgi:hypothetical protein
MVGPQDRVAPIIRGEIQRSVFIATDVELAGLPIETRQRPVRGSRPPSGFGQGRFQRAEDRPDTDHPDRQTCRSERRSRKRKRRPSSAPWPPGQTKGAEACRGGRRHSLPMARRTPKTLDQGVPRRASGSAPASVSQRSASWRPAWRSDCDRAGLRAGAERWRGSSGASARRSFGEQLIESLLDVMTNAIDHVGMLLSWHGWSHAWLQVTTLPGAVGPPVPGTVVLWRTRCTGRARHRPGGRDRATTPRSATTARRADSVTPARGVRSPRGDVALAPFSE